jgi:hypothetical protein
MYGRIEDGGGWDYGVLYEMGGRYGRCGGYSLYDTLGILLLLYMSP